MKFQVLSFGDETGFVGNEGTAIPRRTSETSSVGSCGQVPNTGGPKYLELQHAPPGISTKTQSAAILPADFWPVNFSSLKLLKGISFKSYQETEPCCPGNSCARSKARTEQSCLGCQPVTRLDPVSCSSPTGTCKSPIELSLHCIVPETGVEYLCLEIDFVLCNEPIPLPTPFPTATPVPTPTRRPRPAR